MPDFSIELSHLPKTIAGVDEVGRGPLAGPVVAAAVMFYDRNIVPTNINDSKKLSPIKRDALFEKIKAISHYGIGIVERDKIDEINILNATKLAMQMALEALCSKLDAATPPPQLILVDGNQKIIFRNTEVIPVVKGDSKSLTIAAASILAKVTRDRIMADLHEVFPQYNWLKNVGYPTPDHLRALNDHGICEHHRRSYAPVKKILSA